MRTMLLSTMATAALLLALTSAIAQPDKSGQSSEQTPRASQSDQQLTTTGPKRGSGQMKRRDRARGSENHSRGPQADEVDSVTKRMTRWKAVPPDHKRTPDQGSPEWTREQAEAAEKDRVLDRKIRSICRGC
jgi:hypothetical protein